MQITFELVAPAGTTWSEDDLAGLGDALPATLAGLMPLYGRLILLDEDQDEETTISDDFDTLMRELCLRSVPMLAQHKDMTYMVAAYSEEVRFVFDGDSVHIEGDATPELYTNADALAPALLAAGERYVALKTRQLGADGIGSLGSYLDEARSAI